MRCKPVAYALIISVLAIAGCGDKKPSSTNDQTSADKGTDKTNTDGAAPASNPAGTLKDLKVEDTKPGKGKAAANGDTVWVLYTGKLANGTKFDSTADHGNKPLMVEIGAGQVIPGWEKGLVGIKVGGERKLSIPYKMAYGELGSDKIPGKADLFFDITALALVKKGEENIVEIRSDHPGSGTEVKDTDKVTINYTIKLPNGEVADSQKGITVQIGKNVSMPGLESGLIGMKQGGKRTLVIPPLAGFPYGRGKVPAMTVVTVDVEVTKVQKA